MVVYTSPSSLPPSEGSHKVGSTSKKDYSTKWKKPLQVLSKGKKPLNAPRKKEKIRHVPRKGKKPQPQVTTSHAPRRPPTCHFLDKVGHIQ